MVAGKGKLTRQDARQPSNAAVGVAGALALTVLLCPRQAAAADVIDWSVTYGGIHFRSACNDGQAMGRRVADYVLANALQRIHGNAPSSP